MLKGTAALLVLVLGYACSQADGHQNQRSSTQADSSPPTKAAQYVVVDSESSESAASNQTGQDAHDDQGSAQEDVMAPGQLQKIAAEFALAEAPGGTSTKGLHFTESNLSESEGARLFEKCRKSLAVETEGEYVTKLVEGSIDGQVFSITAPNAVVVLRGGSDIKNAKIRFRSADGEDHEGLYCVFASSSKSIKKLTVSTPCGSRVSTFIESGKSSKIYDTDCYIDYDAKIAAKEGELEETQVALWEALEACQQDREGRAACKREANTEYKPTIKRIKQELKLLQKQKSKQDKNL